MTKQIQRQIRETGIYTDLYINIYVCISTTYIRVRTYVVSGENVIGMRSLKNNTKLANILQGNKL